MAPLGFWREREVGTGESLKAKKGKIISVRESESYSTFREGEGGRFESVRLALLQGDIKNHQNQDDDCDHSHLGP